MDWLLLLKWFLFFDIVCFDQCHIILNFFTAISPLWLKCLKSISLQPFRKQDGGGPSLSNIDKKTVKAERLVYLCYLAVEY